MHHVLHDCKCIVYGCNVERLERKSGDVGLGMHVAPRWRAQPLGKCTRRRLALDVRKDVGDVGVRRKSLRLSPEKQPRGGCGGLAGALCPSGYVPVCACVGHVPDVWCDVQYGVT